MTIQAVGLNYANNVRFCGKENSEVAPKEKASTMKKWGVGLASYAMPGVGQLVNGDGKKAALFAVPYLLLRGMRRMVITENKTISINSLGSYKLKKPLEVKPYIGINPRAIRVLNKVGKYGALAVLIASIVDAVKHAKPDAKVENAEKVEMPENIDTQA